MFLFFLINRNMRCIEIYFFLFFFGLGAAINRNMRCIEMVLFLLIFIFRIVD